MRSGCPFPYASVPTKGKVTRIIHKNLHLREQNCVLALPPYFFWTFHIPPFPSIAAMMTSLRLTCW